MSSPLALADKPFLPVMVDKDVIALQTGAV